MAQAAAIHSLRRASPKPLNAPLVSVAIFVSISVSISFAISIAISIALTYGSTLAYDAPAIISRLP
jgi:hypothetical protein